MATKTERLKTTATRGASSVLEDARQAGLLDGDKTEHVSFRAPRALLEAARRETGIESPTEVGYSSSPCLNDALILLSAAEAGLPVLTANRDEFDIIQPLAPEGRFIHF